MNPYDQAHALARAMKESEEYREMMRLKETAYESDTNRALLDEYKRLQFRLQAKVASGETMPEEDYQRLQQIGGCCNSIRMSARTCLRSFAFSGCCLRFLRSWRMWPEWIWTCSPRVDA